MKLALFLLPKAEADIDAHCAFIARTRVEKALMFDKAVFESLDLLCERPLIGTRNVCVNPKLDGLRMWFVKGFEHYLIFYRPFGNYIEVVRILHSAQERHLALEEE